MPSASRRPAKPYRPSASRSPSESRRFLSVYEQYSLRDVASRIYLETMRDVLMKMDKVLIDGGKNGNGVVPYLPLESLRQPTQRPQTGETRPGGQQ